MKTLALYLLAMMLFERTYGQKLPNVQKESLRAPGNVKIDGKLNEWGGKLQAYNKVAEIFYTIANDDNNLYLAIQATDPEIIEKIIAGGVTLTINTSGNKNEKNAAIITFPIYQTDKDHPYLNLSEQKKTLKKDAVNNQIRMDSLKNAGNYKLKNAFKFIGTSGLNTIADELIPIYNTDGILAAAILDDDLFYNCEIAIPIKLFADGSAVNQLTYNVKLNGHAFGGSDVGVLTSRFVSWVGRDGNNYRMDDNSPRSWSLATASDFWSEYTLAK